MSRWVSDFPFPNESRTIPLGLHVFLFSDACGSVLDLSTGSHGMVQSPGFPGAYPANRDCSWKFWIPTGFDFSVKFLNFDLEDDHLCSFDYVELIDQTDEGIVIRLLALHACCEQEPTLTNHLLTIAQRELVERGFHSIIAPPVVLCP